jgi:hypothetical protein
MADDPKPKISKKARELLNDVDKTYHYVEPDVKKVRYSNILKTAQDEGVNLPGPLPETVTEPGVNKEVIDVLKSLGLRSRREALDKGTDNLGLPGIVKDVVAEGGWDKTAAMLEFADGLKKKKSADDFKQISQGADISKTINEPGYLRPDAGEIMQEKAMLDERFDKIKEALDQQKPQKLTEVLKPKNIGEIILPNQWAYRIGKSLLQGEEGRKTEEAENIFDEQVLKPYLQEKYKNNSNGFLESMQQGLVESITSGFGFLPDLRPKMLRLEREAIKNNEEGFKLLGIDVKPKAVVESISKMIPDVIVGLGASSKLMGPVMRRLANEETVSGALNTVSRFLGDKVGNYLAAHIPNIMQTTGTFTLPTISRDIISMAKGDLQPVDMSSDVGHSLLLGAAFGLNPFGDEVKKLYEDASKDFGKVIRGVKMTPEEKLFTEKAFKELQIGRDAMAKGEMELPEYQNLRNNLLGEIEKPIKRAVDETPYEIPKIFQNRFNAAQFKGLLYDALVPPMASQVPGLMSGKGFNGKEF